MIKKVLGCLWLMAVVVSCKSSQQVIVPITDDVVEMEFGELGDLDEEEDEAEPSGDEEGSMTIKAITDEDVQAEMGGPVYVPEAPPVPKKTTSTASAASAPEDEPINAALLLDTGQVLLTDSESSIMLEEVEVVGFVHETQYPLEPIKPRQITFLNSSGATSAPRVEEVKVRGYSPLNIEDKISFGKQLKVKPLEVKDDQLYSYIKEQLGKPYQKGRMDHLTLMQNLYGEVYEVNFPRTASKAILTNYTEGKIHYTKDMEEGDLLFFRLKEGKKPYTHIGIYLKNKRFLTVTPSGGVEIVNLRDRLWQGAYIGRGRVKNMKR